MPDINDLRQKRAKLNDEAQALATLEAAGTELTAEQVEAFASIQQEFAALTLQIQRLEVAEQMAAAVAKPLPTQGALAGNGYGYSAQPKTPDVKGAKVARMIQAIGATGRGGREAAHYAETVLGDADVAMALNTGAATAGGVLVPKDFMADVVELLMPKSVVRSMGAIALPMPHGNLTVPKMTGGATSYYVSESQAGTASEQTFGDLSLSAKHMITLVPVSNQLLQYSGVNQNVESLIVGDMVNSMGLREDLAYIRGDGLANTPKGFRNLAPVANVVVASAGTSIALVETDLSKLELKLLNANVRMLKPGWVMNPTTFMFLMSQRDGNGNKVYPELAQNQLRGKPLAVTTQVPSNLGTGTESEVYLVDFADAIIGESGTVSLAISTEASYTDPVSGTVKNAFTSNQTLIRAVSSNDFGMRHDASVAVLTGVKWGAV
jgi:HK97 family phage major capsid protein